VDAIPVVSEDEFARVIAATRPYVVLILKAGARYETPGRARSPAIHALIAAHAMRNSGMQKAGLMPIVCPIADASGVTGVGVFDLTVEDATRFMDGDPAVQAGVLTYELHTCFSLPIPSPAQP